MTPHDQKKFDVQYDPARVTPQQLLAAVQGLGYRPTVDGPISAIADTSAVAIKAKAGAAGHAAGATGEVVVKLSPKAGNRLGGEGQVATKVVVTGTDMVQVPNGEVRVAEALSADREVKIPIRIKDGATAGEQVVVVRVTFQARSGDTSAAEQTIELRIPVVIQ